MSAYGMLNVLERAASKSRKRDATRRIWEWVEALKGVARMKRAVRGWGDRACSHAEEWEERVMALRGIWHIRKRTYVEVLLGETQRLGDVAMGLIDRWYYYWYTVPWDGEQRIRQKVQWWRDKVFLDLVRDTG